jgi:galactokinase
MNNTAMGEAFGRVNLMGEHVDYNAGCVIPLQINRSVKVSIKQNNNIGGINIKSENYDDEILANVLSKKMDNWADFIIGACFIFSEEFNISIEKLFIDINSNLPIGIGVSSSAAVTVAMLRALSNYYKIDIQKEKLVKLSHSVEKDFVGVAGGLMDQFASIYGATDKALFLDTKSNKFELIEISNNYDFLIIDSGKQRILTDGTLNEKKESCRIISKKLNIEHLCQLSELGNENIKVLSNNEVEIARHVILENQRSILGKTTLAQGDLEQFGRLMTQSHKSLRDLYKVSTSELDLLVDLCNSFGSLGSKLTGAGFGGAIVTLIKKELVEDLKMFIIENYPNAKFF